MSSIISSSLALPALTSSTFADYIVDSSFKLDVHSHVVPDIYKAALIAGGYPVENGTVFTDGFPVPTWDLTSHIAAIDTNGISYSTISISAPGVSFLADDCCQAATLARELNLAIYNYTQQYPTRLGAMCILSLLDVESSLLELEVYTPFPTPLSLHPQTPKLTKTVLPRRTLLRRRRNVHQRNGTYLDDSALNPIFSALNNRSATVFVHPAEPTCSAVALGHPGPMTEYPFESVRAMENMLLTGQHANYSSISIIFPHGGGAMPYIATRITGMASLSILGSLSVATTLAQFKNYIFDTASSTMVMQLIAMKEFFFFGGTSNIVTGTDFPYDPQTQAIAGLEAIQGNGNFTAA
ncbi:hypothetical protein G7Y89_g11622 [Cudoniella acicularis]|uniref:Amidohydrolase-related domain-containing protein n=1 Tax=Cudoniella acicularis TaxID=354080 RepID=A0A8H4RBN0_9HELO|nr:hypothetical protein G7Y89_g11622 [Cudoniella acicularis]